MLKSWSIENFKPIVNSGEIKFAPVTVLAGMNSSGKTSLLQSILMIAQTLGNQVVDRPLIYNGPLVQLGTFADILNHTTDSQTLVIGFELDLIADLQDNPISEDDLFSFIEHTGTRAINIKLLAKFNRIPDSIDNTNSYAIESLNSLLESSFLKVIPEITWTTRSRSSLIEHGELEFVVRRLAKNALNEYLENIASSYLRFVPYNGNHPNYLGEVKAQDRQIIENGLITLSHFLPGSFIQKFSLKKRHRRQLKNALFSIAIFEREYQTIADFGDDDENVSSDTEIPSIIEEIKKIIDQILTDENITPEFSIEQPDTNLIQWLHRLKTKVGEEKTKELSKNIRTDINRKIHEIDLNEDDFLHGLEVINDYVDLLTIDQAVKQITRFFSSKIRYLGPLRVDPQASQKFASSSEFDDVGAKGEYAAAVYEAHQTRIIDWYNPISKQVEQSTLKDALNHWASYLGVAKKIMINSAGYSGFSWQVVHKQNLEPLPLAAVGFGISQVLPILVMGLLAPKNTLLIIEQPELHLHPRVQARLGDFFMGLSKCDKQCLIETHSENLISQLRYHIVQAGGQEQSDCLIYFVDQDIQGATQFNPIEISPQGNILNWPDGFFDETMLQEDRITAASLKKRAQKAHNG